jgi:ABC-type lipoprotein export system ATPase subunit
VSKDPAAKEIFRTVHVRKFYPTTQVAALQDVSLSVMKGEFVGIKGPSGSGKSTLLYLLAGLIPPTSGEVYFYDKPFKSIRNKALYRRENLGFIFQDFYLYPHFTVLENILFPFLHQLIVPSATIKKAKRYLEYLHMDGKTNMPVEVLSAGERQRVCIARALLHEPQCILADEPTGNLDSKNAKNILELLEKINREYGTTILMVTHDEQVSHYAHRLVYMTDGALEGRT